MNMIVTERAQEFIAQEGGIITAKLEQRLIPNCCNPPSIAPVPSVKLGKPEEHESAEYEAFVIDGAEVYAHTSIQNYSSEVLLRIDTETTLFGKRLVLYGLPVPAKNCGNCTSC
ncbi:hypothetical protein [Sporomusa sp.]|uniref:hypothetical protein n=1 Tax=Sporomusa sp. TaxID=2078658 RepID=UPI002C848394|nr:hypothetical protein [Sporomusa sp.]HWR43765.1 hypothetical protein [Sporomusa sp.]